MHTHAGKLTSKLTSKFFYTCHLVLVSSFSSLPLFVPLFPSNFVCLSHYFCNQVERCLGCFHTLLTPSVYCFPSLSPLALPSLLQSSNQCCAVHSASSITLPLRALMPSLSPPLLSHCLSILLLFPPSHSVTKQLTALYMLISLPQTPSLCALSLSISHSISVLKKW